jgi:hypothetical protein
MKKRYQRIVAGDLHTYGARGLLCNSCFPGHSTYILRGVLTYLPRALRTFSSWSRTR